MATEPLNDHDPLKELAQHDGIPAPTGDANLIDTDYVIGQDNFSGNFFFNVDIHGKVFTISSLAVVLFVVLTLALQSEVAPMFTELRNWLTGHLAWFFIGAANIFVLLCLFLIVSPLGKVRLGGIGRQAGLQLSGLVLDAVCCRHGYRVDVLWRLRADVALRLIAGRGDPW